MENDLDSFFEQKNVLNESDFKITIEEDYYNTLYSKEVNNFFESGEFLNILNKFLKSNIEKVNIYNFEKLGIDRKEYFLFCASLMLNVDFDKNIKDIMDSESDNLYKRVYKNIITFNQSPFLENSWIEKTKDCDHIVKKEFINIKESFGLSLKFNLIRVYKKDGSEEVLMDKYDNNLISYLINYYIKNSKNK